MNKDNFKKLIDAILLDGQHRFNMACFVGKINLSPEMYQEYIIENEDLVSLYDPYALPTVETTDMFNCDSVGCIAGFATALANDWKTPEFLKPELQMNSREVVQSFEEKASEFLGLTVEQGKKLYYGGDDCIWKYLRYYESYNYPNLKYVGEDDYEADEIVEGYCNWNDGDYEIEFSSIDYKTAADVLTRIMNGEIVLGSDIGDIEVKDLSLVGEVNENV